MDLSSHAPDLEYWHSRGYLPHFQSPHVIQHVVFHLADSLPQHRRLQLRTGATGSPASHRSIGSSQPWQDLLDRGLGCCLLRLPIAAQALHQTLHTFSGTRYDLHAWVIMPNHVHVLFRPLPPWTLARCVASWKAYTGRRLSQIADAVAVESRAGGARRVWAREYWDRFIRDDEHGRSVLRYIHMNPVKAGLVERPEDWEWSSARLWAAQGTAGLQPGGPSIR
jgi:putative transposase